MVILGVDPGVTVGLVTIEIVDGLSWKLVKRWEVTPKGSSRGEELAAIGWALTDSTFQPSSVAMEEMLAYRMHSADEKVEAQAMVKVWCYQTQIPLVTYAPTTIRSAVIGNGRATPADIKATLRFLCRMGKTSKKGQAFTVHEQDALAVALCHALRSGSLQMIDRCMEV